MTGNPPRAPDPTNKPALQNAVNLCAGLGVILGPRRLPVAKRIDADPEPALCRVRVPNGKPERLASLKGIPGGQILRAASRRMARL